MRQQRIDERGKGQLPPQAQALLAAALAGLVGVADAGEQSGVAALESFGSCGPFTQYVREHAMAMVGPWGLGGGGGPMYYFRAGDGGPVPEMGVQGLDDGPATEFSGTNVQEQGVDEPDMVKTDGRTVYAIAQGQLHAVDVSGKEPQLLDSLDLGDAWGQQLLLHGDRLLLISSGWGGQGGGGIAIDPGFGGRFAPWWGRPSTTLTEIDVSDPAALRVLDTVEMDSEYLSARRVGAAVRLVVRSVVSGPALEYPTTWSAEDQARTTWRNKWILSRSKSRDWLPRYTINDHETGKSSSRELVRCSQMSHPTEFGGLGTISVLTLDLERGIAPVDADAILSDGDTVYASAGSLYVATREWQDTSDDPDAKPVSVVNTAIHRFDTSDPGQTTYSSSGQVDGYLMSQWSMSEHQGKLRVVSTDEPPWWGEQPGETSTRLTVLAEQDGALSPIGSLEGLGKGEHVYAVRFIGDLGYVVTFRQVDPLYVIDVSKPAAPILRGELKIPGYSAYLHPVGEGLLLGVGRSATPEGRVLGVQASVFDVSNPDNPLAVQQLDLGNGWTESEFDHHAFLYWPATRQALIPIESWIEDAATGAYTYSSGAVGLKVESTGLSELGRISHEALSKDPAQPIQQVPIRRTLVVGDTLISVSDAGLQSAELDTLKERVWLAFPERVYGEEPVVP